jgi:hypothetical protein
VHLQGELKHWQLAAWGVCVCEVTCTALEAQSMLAGHVTLEDDRNGPGELVEYIGCLIAPHLCVHSPATQLSADASASGMIVITACNYCTPS